MKLDTWFSLPAARIHPEAEVEVETASRDLFGTPRRSGPIRSRCESRNLFRPLIE
jgi:hypothetical protein